LAFGVFFVLNPPFRIVTLEETRNQLQDEGFDASAFVETFWTERLSAALDSAVGADTLLEAIRKDPVSARQEFAHEFGIGETYYYFVSGKGFVHSVDASSAKISVSKSSGSIEFRLLTGNIFGNAVRNGTGLLNVSDFPSSRDFNAVSQELNRLVETRVLPSFRQQVETGLEVSFVGCAEIDVNDGEIIPLVLVPVALELRPESE
jgi:predicted lipoprotein